MFITSGLCYFLKIIGGTNASPVLVFPYSVLKSSQQRFVGQLLSVIQWRREKCNPGEEVLIITEDLQGTEVVLESAGRNRAAFGMLSKDQSSLLRNTEP